MIKTKIKKKYPHLEISILPLSEIHEDNIAKRIDSEYFQNEFLNTIETIKKQKHIQLKDTDIHIMHPTEIKREYVEQNEEDSVWFFRTQNLRPLFIDTELNRVHISQEDAFKLKKNIIRDGDILITRTGANCGDCALYDNEEQAIASSHVLIVRNSFFMQSFLAVFLNTSFGKIQINRGIYGGLQPEIAPYYLKNIYIPTFSISFQQEIDKIVKNSKNLLKQSKLLYKEAQDILYTELGLDPNNPLGEIEKEEENLSISIQTLQESYIQTGRLDAEYYQAKYKMIEKILYRFQTTKLKDLVIYPISSGSTPKAGGENYTNSTDGIRFLRVVDIKNGQIDEDSDFLYIKDEVHTGMLKRTRLIKGDILFSIAGTIGRCALFNHDFEANINQALAILRFSETKDIRKLYLVAFFNSSIGQAYLEKYARQGVQTNLNLDEVRNLVVPKMSLEIQEKIANKIQDSFNLQKKAKNLLKEAIAQVEAKISAQV